MITKKIFIQTLNKLHEYHVKFGLLRDAAEELSHGEHINFMPEATYEELIANLLTQDLIPPHTANDSYNVIDGRHYSDIINYFIYDLEFGTYYTPGVCFDAETHELIDISTAEKLYDYIIKTYHTPAATTATAASTQQTTQEDINNHDASK